MFAFRMAKGLEKADRAGRALRLGLGVGLTAGWATLIEYPAAPAAMILAGYAVLNAWRSGLRSVWQVAFGVFLGAIVCITILATYNLIAFHSALTVGYKYQVFFPETAQGILGITYPKPRVMAKLLVHPYRGLLLTAPVLLLAPVGLLILWRNARTRWHSVVLAAIPLYYFLLNASYVNWFGGSCYGPRYLFPGLFFLAPALAMIWTSWPRVRALPLGLSAVGLTLALIAVPTTPMPNEAWADTIPGGSIC